MIISQVPTHYLILVGWGASSPNQGFGEPPTVKSQLLNLVRSIRTVAKSELKKFHHQLPANPKLVSF